MSSLFPVIEDDVKNYISVSMGDSKQRVPVLTTSNGADWKRVFSAALDGTDMKYVLEEEAEEGKLLEITSDEELISTDEDEPETTPARRNLSGEEKERDTARMIKQQWSKSR